MVLSVWAMSQGGVLELCLDDGVQEKKGVFKLQETAAQYAVGLRINSAATHLSATFRLNGNEVVWIPRAAICAGTTVPREAPPDI